MASMYKIDLKIQDVISRTALHICKKKMKGYI